MKIAVASDHAGFPLKAHIAQFLKKKNIEIKDLGVDKAESVDYPDYAIRVAELVSVGQMDAGILICGTGIGMSIAANKFKGVRAAMVTDVFSAKATKEHNNANVLCLGCRVTEPQEAEEIVDAWLSARYEGGRHQKRLDKISDIEKRNFK